ncbi:uncharacterized protein [Periplaneta americana]|uniref:uncharacterized protein n=1 Tax=Periplaneta americana TaxID=6978 RepID=UPI0037E84FEA
MLRGCYLRLIGTFAMILALIVLIQCLVEMKCYSGIGDGQYALLIGVNIDAFDVANFSFRSSIENYKYFQITCCVYATTDILTNVLLVYATVKEVVSCVIPWVLLNTISFMYQIFGIVVTLSHNELKSSKLYISLFRTATTFILLSSVLHILHYWPPRQSRYRYNDEDEMTPQPRKRIRCFMCLRNVDFHVNDDEHDHYGQNDDEDDGSLYERKRTVIDILKKFHECHRNST